jgi:hypothetical protein
MKIENQVCTLEQAKKLNKLGIAQGVSVFFHNIGEGKVQMNDHPFGAYFNAEYCFSAFSVAELGEMLPTSSDNLLMYWSAYNDHQGNWMCDLYNLEKWDGLSMPPAVHNEEGETEAEARAAMLIWILETGEMSAEEVNSRIPE